MLDSFKPVVSPAQATAPRRHNALPCEANFRFRQSRHGVAGGANKRGEIINRIFGPSDTSDSISPYFERLIALRL
jgi:hypothetical protein